MAGVTGCEFLTQGRWERLQVLHLGRQYLMKTTTLSEMQAASISPKPTGPTSRPSTWVQMVLSTGNNEIGEKSVRHLSKAQWPCLSVINLSHFGLKIGNNRVCSQGWASLSRANWQQLSRVNLRKIISIKMGTSSMRMRTSARS